MRDPLTHPNNTDQLDGVTWFGSVVVLRPGGDVDYLVDPDSHQHEAAMALVQALIDYFSKVISDAIAADPPKPLRDQIEHRKSKLPRNESI